MRSDGRENGGRESGMEGKREGKVYRGMRLSQEREGRKGEKEEFMEGSNE